MTANPAFDRSAYKLRCSVPSSLRSSAPPEPRRWASRDVVPSFGNDQRGGR
jgi:hypothetical protein